MPASTEVKNCEYCAKSLRSHPRCSACQILLHPAGKLIPELDGVPEHNEFDCRCGKVHGLKGESGKCVSCSK